ncbi:MAG TPA: FadR/GntR family transcriptional regulator [Bacillales bacterium]|nr:FadR/GntR family transcriptional regulator [Bacillales bacterium]
MSQLLYEQIVEHLEEEIYNGALKEGEKLPSERELAAHHQVSRNVVREAIGALRQKGLVVVKPGKGAYVNRDEDGMITDTLKQILRGDLTTAADILEVREVLEKAIIRRAVDHATDKHLNRLTAIYEQMERCKQDVNRFVKEDARFHMTLAESTQNKLFVLLNRSLHELTEGTTFSITRFTPYSVGDAQIHHWQLIDAIRSKDVERAVQTIDAHIAMLRNEVEMLVKRHETHPS